MTRKRIVVHGRVQGVGFRHYAREQAQQLGLRGWIRNRADGQRVEILVEGDPAQMDAFLRWCKQGPPSARVARVDAEDDPGTEPLEGWFGVRSTI